MIQTFCMGWDEPASGKVFSHLLEYSAGELDFSRIMVVVPTREAGRRLREGLARRANAQGKALQAPRVGTTTFFLHPTPGEQPEASPAAVLHAWMDALQSRDTPPCPALFPVETERTPAWALRMGRTFQQLRNDIVEGGWLAADLASHEAVLEDQARWTELAELEALYLKELAQRQLQDPCMRRILRSEDPQIPTDIDRIVVAMVPDPTLLLTRALKALSKKISIDILLHAPAELAEHFDEWGRPHGSYWPQRSLALEDRHYLPASNPDQQAERVLDLLATEATAFGPDDVAVGVPDEEVIPPLERLFQERDLGAASAASCSLSQHPIGQLAERLCCFKDERDAQSLAALMRHPDLLDALAAHVDLSAWKLLKQLDTLLRDHLPVRAEHAERTAEANTPELAKAIRMCIDYAEQLDATGPEALRTILQEVYTGRMLRSAVPRDAEWKSAAETFEQLITEVQALSCKPASMALLLLRSRLAETRYDRQLGDRRVDVEGWLELSWNDAPFMVVTGMNDGMVPDLQPPNPYLPDRVHKRLGLRCADERLTRDAFLLHALQAARPREGQLFLISGRRNAAGDPLKPSRLLFMCPDEHLAERTKIFVQEDEVPEPLPVSDVPFKLVPRQAPPRLFRAGTSCPDHFSASSLKVYLQCPFRYFLDRILKMHEVEPETFEPDARAFGNLVHEAFKVLYTQEDLRTCTDEERLCEALQQRAQEVLTTHYGAEHLLSVDLLQESLMQRLAAAAHVQAGLAAAGWEIDAVEAEHQMSLAGSIFTGRIDRVDRHVETGRLRIIDYKTSEKAKDPAKAHFGSTKNNPPEWQCTPGKKPKRWIDLQLPMYVHLLGGVPEQIEVAYFNLPKASGETSLTVWDTLDRGLIESAKSCAEAAMQAIQDGCFWPPTEGKVDYDNFATLLGPEAQDRIDPDQLAHWVFDEGGPS